MIYQWRRVCGIVREACFHGLHNERKVCKGRLAAQPRTLDPQLALHVCVVRLLVGALGRAAVLIEAAALARKFRGRGAIDGRLCTEGRILEEMLYRAI